MLKQRLISAFLGAIVVVAVLLSSEAVVSAAIAVVTIIALTEMYKCLGLFKENKMLAVIGYVFSLLYMGINLILRRRLFFNFQAAAYMMTLFVYMVFTHDKTSFSKVAKSFMATVYITICFMHVVFIRNEYAGFFLIWLVFLTAWMTDTFAYTFGMLFGKHKLIPNVSPKKSVEGAIGGIIGCIAINVLITYIVSVNTGLVVNYLNLIVMLFLASIVSQLGDLAASCIKRDEDIKDFGNIMPGHGGILDRCDSVLFVAPFMYYFVKLFVVFG